MSKSRRHLARVTEPSFSPEMIHYIPPPGCDRVTLCGKTDWLGEEQGEPTTASATCSTCNAIVNHVFEQGGRLALAEREEMQAELRTLRADNGRLTAQVQKLKAK